MQETPDVWFELWCRRGDTRALGHLFDATAPELLRVAVHMVGDAATAEDLVQAAFVALIEQRTKIDGSRPVMPWLTGVIANKAQQYKRTSAREIDVDRLRERVELAPDELAERAEFSAEVAKALDGLREPYRQAVLLRVRHGMAIADIAHVLDRSPGAVRVQLHRGLQQLRELLPAALASTLLIGLIAPRGLAAIKTHIVAEAALATATVSTGSILGGVLVAKKLVLALAAAAVLIALWWASSELARDQRVTDVEPVIAAETRAIESESERPIAPKPEVERDVSQRDEVPDVSASSSSSFPQVFDAETGAPLAGAKVSWFAGRTTNARELRRERATYFASDSTGRLVGRTRVDWPALIGKRDAAHVGRAPLLALDVPLANQKALASTITADDGSFTLARQDGYGIVEVALAGYATRWKPCRDGTAPARIALWREREVRGRLVVIPGAIDEPIELVLIAVSKTPPLTDGAAVRGELSDTFEGLGCWPVTTATDGSFRTTVGAAEVRVDVLTPGYKVLHPASYATNDSNIEIHVTRVARWHFFDAASGAPIERVRVLGRVQSHGYVRWSDELVAPGGFAMPPGDHMFWTAHQGSPFGFTAWADGYLPTSWIVADVHSLEQVEIPMVAGELPTLMGDVLRDGVPLEDADVALFGHNALSWNSNDSNFALLVDASTTPGGRFVLRAPPGSYVLRVKDGDETHSRVVALPSDVPIVIDLARQAAIEVQIVNEAGVPQTRHVVGLFGPGGRGERASTDERGLVRFEGLSAGTFRVGAPHTTTEGSFAAEVIESVELLDGLVASVRLTVFGTGAPRHARIAARATTNYSGWRARFDEREWTDVVADGTVPLDLATDAWTMHVLAPDGRSWNLDIPKDKPHGFVIELEAGTARLAGVVLGASGAPLADLRIDAQPWGSCSDVTTVATTARTDAAGRFELEGLGACEYQLYVYDAADVLLATFTPVDKASDDPKAIEIRFPSNTSKTRFHGRVLKADETSASGARVSIDALHPSSSGTLRLAGGPNAVTTDLEGRYEFDVTRAPQYRVGVRADLRGPTVRNEVLTDDGRDSRRLDFDLP